jgi:hypothetical protein
MEADCCGTMHPLARITKTRTVLMMCSTFLIMTEFVVSDRSARPLDDCIGCMQTVPTKLTKHLKAKLRAAAAR